MTGMLMGPREIAAVVRRIEAAADGNALAKDRELIASTVAAFADAQRHCDSGNVGFEGALAVLRLAVEAMRQGEGAGQDACARIADAAVAACAELSTVSATAAMQRAMSR
jgi:hypothetical protein